MHPRARQLYLRVIDGQKDLAVLCWHINQHHRSVDILQWLVAHQFTGLKLMALWKDEHQNSMLRTISFIVMRLEKETRPRAVLASEFGNSRGD